LGSGISRCVWRRVIQAKNERSRGGDYGGSIPTSLHHGDLPAHQIGH